MDLDELLDAIIASIFLIIVSLIGIYFPYIVARIFGTHNPYLILEVAGFITYSTSEPGNMDAAFLVTNEPTFLYEFRIMPPMPSYSPPNPLYNNNDFFVSIGECYEHNLWQQLGYDLINSFMTEAFSYVHAFGSAGAEEALNSLNDIFESTKSFAKQTLMGFTGMYSLYTEQSAYLQYSNGNHNIWGDIFNALQSSVGPALFSTVEFSVMSVGDIILDEVLPPGLDFVAGVAFNMAFSGIITVYEYLQSTSNPYASCYYNQFISQGKVLFFFPNGHYAVYQPYLTLSIYYNPNFTFYNGCEDYYLCNTSFKYIYNSFEESQDNIFKLDLGNTDNNGQEVFPEFIILSKVGLEYGGPYLNVSVLSSKS